MASQTIVRLDAVWHHVGSSISDGEGGLISALALEIARLASDFGGGEVLRSGEVGAGDAVEVRDLGVFLTGDGSVAGKSPCGCERVDTMTMRRNQDGVRNQGFSSNCEERNGRENVTCRNDAKDARELVENGFCFSRAGLYLRREGSTNRV